MVNDKAGLIGFREVGAFLAEVAHNICCSFCSTEALRRERELTFRRYRAEFCSLLATSAMVRPPGCCSW